MLVWESLSWVAPPWEVALSWEVVVAPAALALASQLVVEKALRVLRHLHTWPCCNPLACSPQLGILSVTSV